MGAAVLFLLSWLLFEPSTKLQANPSRDGLGVRTRGIRAGRWSPFGVFAVPRSWKRAFAWKDFHFLAGGKVFFLLKFLLFGFIVGGSIVYACPDALDPGQTIAQRLAQLAGGTLWRDAATASMFILMCALGFELSVYASRVFFDEIRFQSLPILLLVPTSISRIGWGKVGGCLLGVLPGLFWLIVSAMLGVWKDPTHIVPILVSPRICWGLLQFITFLHIVALLSLYVRWGALPLAIVLSACLLCCPVTSFGFMVAEMYSQDQSVSWGAFSMSLFGLAVYWLVLLYPLEIEIAARLRYLAGRS